MDYSNLHDDISMEILSRTSLKAFDAICSTTKQIRNLKYDPYFLHLYKRRNNIVSGFLVQTINGFHEFAPSKNSTPLDLGFLSPEDSILAASEKGIIVFETPNPTHYRRKLYRVCKPATNQVFELPNPKANNLTENVAIMVLGSNPFRYKIMRLSLPKHSYSQRSDERCTKYYCEIFDSAIYSWRLLDDIKLPYHVFVESSRPITVGGSAYLLLSNYNVLKFDFYSEKWRLIPTPKDCSFGSFGSMKLVTYEGKLALECKPRNSREIWVCSIDEAWKKTFVFDDKEDRERMHLNSFYDSDTSVLVDYNTLVFCKFKKDDSFSKVVLSDMIAKTFGFRSDFEPIDIARSIVN